MGIIGKEGIAPSLKMSGKLRYVIMQQINCVLSIMAVSYYCEDLLDIEMG